MTKEEIIKIINENIGLIVDTAIELGYYKIEQKSEMIKRINRNLENGVSFNITNSEIYGAFIPQEKKIYLNAEVFKEKDKKTLLIYFAHELIHAIDYDEKNNGFNLEDGYAVGINEGATQRKAENIVKKILKINPEIKIEESIGCKIETDLDEYQIQDRYNQLYAEALGIGFENFLQLQGLNGSKGLEQILKLDKLYNNIHLDKKSSVIHNIDMIYKLQEKTWFDKDYDVNESHIDYIIDEYGTIITNGLDSRDYYINAIQEELVKIYVFKNIIENKITNEKEYKELISNFVKNFIIKDDSYLEKYNDYLEEFYFKDSKYIYQNQYNELEKWLKENTEISNKIIVSIDLTYDDNIETVINKKTEMIFREGEEYYKRNVTFIKKEQNIIQVIYHEKKQISLEEIVSHMEHNECDGNYKEYIEVLLKLNKPYEAQKVRIRNEIVYKKQKDIPKVKKEEPIKISYELAQSILNTENEESKRKKH